MNHCEAAICAVKQTGEALIQRLSSMHWAVHRKNNDYQNLVTDCDIWVQETLVKELLRIEPRASIFAEEKENGKIHGLTWIIDPIDGTTNFVAAQKDFAICVALYNGDKPVFGIVHDVAADNTYHAYSGACAYMNDTLLPPREPVVLHDALFDVSLATLNNLSRRADKPLFAVSRALRGHRALGSASLAMCRIAEGRMEGYLSSKLYPWDYAASGIVLQAAGGVYAPLYKKDMLFRNCPTAVLACSDVAMWNQLAAFFRGECDVDSLMANV